MKKKKKTNQKNNNNNNNKKTTKKNPHHPKLELAHSLLDFKYSMPRSIVFYFKLN